MINILFQNTDVVVCIKPKGVLSQNGEGESMISLLRDQLGGEIFPIHRLDREVSGVMVYARTKRGAGFLSEQVQQGRMKKEYLAVVQGRPEAPEGVMEDLLLHDNRRNKSFVVDRQRKGVRGAKLSYCVLDSDGERSLVQVRLFTGRTHQIRVQFSYRSMPLAGDGRYGGGKGSIHLHSCRVTFIDPAIKKEVSFSSLPEEFWPKDIPELKEME